MEIKVKKESDVSILEIEGEIDVYYSSKLEEKVKNLIAQGERKVIIDMTEVSYMDSSGLGVLVGSLKNLKKSKGDMKIAGANKEIMNVFEITRLNTFFDMYKTVPEALAKFK